MGLEIYKGNFGIKEITHLFKDVCLVQSADITSFNGFSINMVVDFLLQDIPLPNPPVNSYNDATYTDAIVSVGTTWVNAVYGDGTVNSRRLTSFKSW